MEQIKNYDVVTIRAYRGTKNERGRVIIDCLPNDAVWVSTIAAPFNGNISQAFRRVDLIKVNTEHGS